MMAGTWMIEQFPQFESALREYVEQHRHLTDLPTHLAVAYGNARNWRDINLLEVVSGWFEEINPDKELFEIDFLPASGLPMEPDQKLHLILTTPQEISLAVAEHWPSCRDLLNALRRRDYQVLFSDRVGKRVLKELTRRTKAEVSAKRA
jgi:hypothetical protein